MPQLRSPQHQSRYKRSCKAELLDSSHARADRAAQADRATQAAREELGQLRARLAEQTEQLELGQLRARLAEQT